MKTVKQIRDLTGVSARTLHYYDSIGLLKPTKVSQAGYRMYDDEAVERLYMILLFREIGFPLKKIRSILDAPDYDRNRILEQQIKRLQQEQTHLQNLIDLTRGVHMLGVKYLDFTGFDPKKLDEQAAQAKSIYGKSEAYKEWEQKVKNRSPEQTKAVNDQVMDWFTKAGQLKHLDPGSEEAQTWVADLRAFFTEHFYNCTPQILKGLGELYGGGGSFTENIDAAGGEGTGAFSQKAIEIYCSRL